MRLLIIRPQPGNDASARRAQEAGFEPVQLPLFRVEPVNWSVADPAHYDALLITSANAIRQGGDALSTLLSLPVHAVGAHSAGIAAKAGFTIASTSASGASEAVAAAGAAGHTNLLWLAGEDRSALEPICHVRVAPVTVYRSVALQPDSDTRDTVAGCDAVALHSIRAAQHFASSLESWGLERAGFAIAAFSPAIAEAAGKGWRAVAVAASPNDDALLSALSALGKQPATGSHEE